MKEEMKSKPSTELAPQTPAEGILKRHSWGDAITYQVTCECHDSDHDHNVWVEADDHRVTVTTYTTQKSKWWSLNIQLKSLNGGRLIVGRLFGFCLPKAMLSMKPISL